MKLRIDKGPISAITPPAELEPSQWRALTSERRSYLAVRLPSDCRMLLQFVEDAEKIYRECGFTSVDEYIRSGLELDPEQVAWAVEGLRRMKPDEPIGYERAVELGKRGRPKKGEEKGDNVTFKRRGNSSAYILARLERDGHAELAAKVRLGKISANAAAMEAGFRRRQTRMEKMDRIWKQATVSEQKGWVTKHALQLRKMLQK